MIKTIELKGDYGQGTTKPERQDMAKSKACVLVVEFHFNSATDASIKGGEVHYQSASAASKAFAKNMWKAFEAISLPAHGEPLRSAKGNKSQFIEHYAMTTILLEPLFLSNEAQAKLLHDPKKVAALAQAIAKTIRTELGETGGIVGLSAGHAYKTTSSNDTGAPCTMNDNERTHTLDLVAQVKTLLA